VLGLGRRADLRSGESVIWDQQLGRSCFLSVLTTRDALLSRRADFEAVSLRSYRTALDVSIPLRLHRCRLRGLLSMEMPLSVSNVVVVVESGGSYESGSFELRFSPPVSLPSSTCAKLRGLTLSIVFNCPSVLLFSKSREEGERVSSFENRLTRHAEYCRHSMRMHHAGW
jgi:hypothetical protein